MGGILLPNTKHMPKTFNHEAYKKSLLRHLATNHLSFIDTAHLCVSSEKGYVGLKPKRQSKKGEDTPIFTFNSAKHRFSLSQLEGKTPSKSQKEYLESEVISHAWAAIHNGIIVGMVFFPILKDHRPNNPKFIDYLSQTNVLLKKIGYFISGSLVLTKDGDLRFYRVLKNKRVGNVVYKYWTQELALTRSLLLNKQQESP